MEIQLAGRGSAPGLHMSSLSGWYSTPDGKWTLTERASGDGSYPISDKSVVYASRSVSIGGFAMASSRPQALEMLGSLLRMAHRQVRITVHDGGTESYATGALTVEAGDGWSPTSINYTATIACPDPRRYGTEEHVAYLTPYSNASGGLDLTEDRLEWPLSWGDSASSASTATLHNGGSSTAYPIITAAGGISDIEIYQPDTGASLSMSGYVGWVPVELDCLTRTASIAGVDVTRRLVRRSFPTIPPGGDVTLSLLCSGSNGSVNVSWRDTYI